MNKLRRNAALVCASLMLFAVPAALPAIQSVTETSAAPVTVGDITLTPGPEVLGSSGNLRALIGMPASLAESLALQPLLVRVPLDEPGVHSLGLTAPDQEPLGNPGPTWLTLTPLTQIACSPFEEVTGLLSLTMCSTHIH